MWLLSDNWEEDNTVLRSRSCPGAHLRFTKPVWCHQGDKNCPPLQYGVLSRQRERSCPRRERRKGHDLGAEVRRVSSKLTEQVGQSVGLFLSDN